jgi:hypothetical protein
MLLGAAILLEACSSTPKRPVWIDKPDSRYSEDTHLAAVGSADEQEVAGDRALANLAKIFEVAVQESTIDFSSAQVGSVDGEQTVENAQEVTRTVSTEARKVLEGSKVAEYWESEEGRVYALAILEKAPAASRFRQIILAQDREIDSLVGYASSAADNPVVALNSLQKARAIRLERDRNNQNLMILTDGQGVKGRYDLAALDELIRNGLASLQVSVDAADTTVRAELQQALAVLGIAVVESSNLVLVGSTDLAPVEEKQGWFWQRGSYELSFADGPNTLAKNRWPIKVSSTDRGLLDQRVRDEINRSLPGYVFALLSTDPAATSP